MQLINRYMKRSVPVITVIAFLLGCMVFPTSATQIETESDTGLLHYDLLLASEYAFLYNDREYLQQHPAIYISPSLATTDIELIWDYRHSNNYTKIIFAFNAVKRPSSVLYNGNPLTYIDCITYPASGDIFFYSYTSSNMVIGREFDIKFEFDSAYAGVIGVYSCVGLLDTAQSITNVDIYRQDCYDITEGYKVVDADPVKNAKLPYSYTASGDYKSNFYIVVDGADFVSPLVNDVSVLLSTCNTTIWSSASLIANNSDGSNISDIKCNLYTVHEWAQSSDLFQGMGMAESYSTFQIDIDLSGYDMSKYDLMISIGVDAIDQVYDVNTPYIDFTLQGIAYVPFVENSPWYKTFFGPIFDGIQKGLSNIVSWITSVGSDISDNFNKLFEKLEEYFGDDGSLAQAGDQMSEQAGQMQDANDSLNSVEKPTLDTGTMFSGLLDFDTGGLTILASMTSNVYVTQLLIVVFTFSLCGYVFFGKRR